LMALFTFFKIVSPAYTSSQKLPKVGDISKPIIVFSAKRALFSCTDTQLEQH